MADRMGASLSVHQGRFVAGGWFWYIGGVLVLAAVPQAVKGAPLVGLVCLLLGAAVLAMPVLRWRQTVEVFENGLVWRRLTGEVTVEKSRVQASKLVTHHERLGTYEEVVITLTDGSELSVVGVTAAEQLRNYVAGWVSPGAGAAAASSAGGWTPPSPGGWTPPASGGMS